MVNLVMRQRNVIEVVSLKNNLVAHEIAWGIGGDMCRAVAWDEFFDSRLLAKGVGLFRNTLAQFLVPGQNSAYHTTSANAESGASRIFIDEIVFDEPADMEGNQ